MLSHFLLSHNLPSAGKLSAREMAAAVTDLLDETQITKVNSTDEHATFIQQQPKLAKVITQCAIAAVAHSYAVRQQRFALVLRPVW